MPEQEDIFIRAPGRLNFVPGTDQGAGLATLIAGTVSVANARIGPNSSVQLTPQDVSGTAGNLSVAKTNGVGFAINSDNALDTRTILYVIVEIA